MDNDMEHAIKYEGITNRKLRLLEMLRRFTSIIREATPAIDSMCVFAAVRGQEYSGPQYGPTLAEAEALLAQYKDVKTEES